MAVGRPLQSLYPQHRVTGAVHQRAHADGRFLKCFCRRVSQLLAFEVAGKASSNNSEVPESMTSLDAHGRLCVFDPWSRTLQGARQNLLGPFHLGCSHICWVLVTAERTSSSPC